MHSEKEKIPHGIVIGFKPFFIAYINISADKEDRGTKRMCFSIKIYSQKPLIEPSKLETEIDKNNKDEDTTQKLIMSLVKNKVFKGSGYKKEKPIKINTELISDVQNNISDEIISKCKLSKENNFNYGGVFLITGESGIGKSFIAKVISLKLKTEFCNHFKLCEAGRNDRK